MAPDDTQPLDLIAQAFQVMIMEGWCCIFTLRNLSSVSRLYDDLTYHELQKKKKLQNRWNPLFIDRIRDYIIFKKKICWNKIPLKHITAYLGDLLCTNYGIRICAPADGRIYPTNSIIHTIMVFTHTPSPIHITIIVNNRPVYRRTLAIASKHMECEGIEGEPRTYCRPLRISEIFASENVDISLCEPRHVGGNGDGIDNDGNEDVGIQMDVDYCIANVSHIRVIYGEYQKDYRFWKTNIIPERLAPFHTEPIKLTNDANQTLCTKSLLIYTKSIENDTNKYLLSIATKYDTTVNDLMCSFYHNMIKYYGEIFAEILSEYLDNTETNIMFLPGHDDLVVAMQFNLVSLPKIKKAVLILPNIHITRNTIGEMENILDFPDIDITRMMENLIMRKFGHPRFTELEVEYREKLNNIYEEMKLEDGI